MDKYIVYVAYHEGVCMYVGEGKPDRYKHLTSGTSHVYEANRHHFKGRSLEVQILHSGLSKASASEIEGKLINELNPCWNKRDFTTSNSDQIRSHVKRKVSQTFDKKLKTHKIQITVCNYFARLLNNNYSVLIDRGQVESYIKDLPSGFMSRCADKSGLYYKKIREIFDIEYDGFTLYRVSLKENIND